MKPQMNPDGHRSERLEQSHDFTGTVKLVPPAKPLFIRSTVQKSLRRMRKRFWMAVRMSTNSRLVQIAGGQFAPGLLFGDRWCWNSTAIRVQSSLVLIRVHSWLN
ncbi:MAG: hypothetical protein HYY24_13905 [Verrucomicrobia bacterium]|nr:hypothetical protein [Verrucomicrobiota bacterium]